MARILVPRPPVNLAVTPTVSGSGTVGSGGGGFSPLFKAGFAGRTVGNSATIDFNMTNNSVPLVYSSDIAGPFGESVVCKVQQTPGDNYYGGVPKTGSLIDTSVGAHLWVRAFFYFPTAWDCGFGTSPSDGFGATKFIRIVWDGSYRNTLTMGGFGDPSGNANIAGPTASTPYIDVLNSEVSSQNISLTKSVIPRNTWVAIQAHWQFNTSGGLGEVWLGTTRLGRSTSWQNRAAGSNYDTINPAFDSRAGLYIPGDYWNGSPLTSDPYYMANVIVCQSAPPGTDSFGNAYIPPTLDARTL